MSSRRGDLATALYELIPIQQSKVAHSLGKNINNTSWKAKDTESRSIATEKAAVQHEQVNDSLESKSIRDEDVS